MPPNQKCRLTLSTSITGLIFSMLVSICAGYYATEKAGPYVGDLLLDNIPRYDVSILHTYLASIFWILLFFYLIKKRDQLAFIFSALSLFLIIRSAFVVMTHLGPPTNFLAEPVWPASLYIHQGDLFFSGHAGAPFLLALLCWNNIVIRYLCLGASLVFGCIVLLGGIHYSIDVFASFFIAHSIYHISRRYLLIQ
jgi:hypothetical protein